MSRVILYVVSVLSLSLFSWGWWLRLRKYRRGRPVPRRGRPSRAKGLLSIASNKTVAKRNRSVGTAHLLAFWGIIALFLIHLVVVVQHRLYPVITSVFGDTVSALLRGRYLAFVFVFNTAGFMVILGTGYLIVRRARSRGPRLDYTRAEKPPEGYSRIGLIAGDWIFLGLLFVNPFV